MFDEAIEYFGSDNIKGIKGVWLGSDGIKDNFDIFYTIYSIEKNNIREAAFSTPTGKIANKRGYTEITIEKPEKLQVRGDIIIKFEKPKN